MPFPGPARLRTTPCGCALVLLLGACSAPGPRADSGVIDLSGWELPDESLALEGEWDAFPGLQAPEALAAVAPGGFRVPGLWPHAAGAATYRLRVRLGAPRTGLALLADEQSSASRLFVDGRLVAEAGRVAEREEDAAPEFGAQAVVALPAAGEHTLVLQVSNFHAHEGGPMRAPRLGSEVALRRAQARVEALDAVFFGAFLVLCLYHLALYALRPRERSFLVFAALCLVIGLRAGLEGSGSRFLLQFVPGFPALSGVMVLLLGLVVALLCTFLWALDVPRLARLSQVSWAVVAGSLLAVVALPLQWVSWTVLGIELWGVVLAPFTVVGLLSDWRRGNPDAPLVLAGFCLFIGVGVYDILADNRVIDGPLLLPFGVLCMVLALAFVLSRRLTRSITAVEHLSGELAAKNRELVRLDAVKDEFLASTTHELRSPLAGMVGIVESLASARDAGSLPAGAQENLELVAATGRRLTHLINDILDFSRLKHRDLRLDLAAVSLRSLAQATLALLGPAAQAKGLALVNAVPPELPPVQADEVRLQQMLHNLLGNAVKFTRTGSVTVSASVSGEVVEVSVTDTGPGIAPEAQAKIFEAYEQAPGTSGGTGLGLAITRQLVELHRGTLRVDSEPGRGARFSFTLPVAGAELPRAPVSTPPPRAHGPTMTPVPPPAAPRAHVLAVDDDPVVQRLVASHLTAAGFAVTTLGSAEEGLAAVERDEPDLVVLDVSLPGMSGYEACRRLRERSSRAELPVILLTANSRLQDLVDGFEFGASDFVKKPVSQQELVARVDAQLAIKEAYQRLQENLRLQGEVADRRLKEQEARVRAEAARAETLRYQLKPHFLFNALSSIRGALAVDPAQARQMVSDLAEYCRRVLTQAPSEVHSLQDEAELTRLFLAMERARWGGHLSAEVSVDPAVTGCRIPSLLLQPLAENALKYGSRTSPEGLSIRVDARRVDGTVEIRVANTGAWVPPAGPSESSTGTGLANVRRRLELAYPGAYALEQLEADGWVTLRIVLPASGAQA